MLLLSKSLATLTARARLIINILDILRCSEKFDQATVTESRLLKVSEISLSSKIEAFLKSLSNSSHKNVRKQNKIEWTLF